MSEFQFTNYSLLSKDTGTRKRYAWCIFMDEEAETLDGVEGVEYILHPTFPDPVRYITDRATKFALQSEGWGTFVIQIRIFAKDGEEHQARHMLELHTDDWPISTKSPSFDSDKTEKIWDELLHSNFNWRKARTLAKKALLSDTQVLEILSDWEEQGLVRKAYFNAIDGLELWGSTAKIGKLPSIDDLKAR